jgi:hypothetical protein
MSGQAEIRGGFLYLACLFLAIFGWVLWELVIKPPGVEARVRIAVSGVVIVVALGVVAAVYLALLWY